MQKFKNNIKNFFPRKNSRYHQGIVPERLLKKYYDSCRNEPVIFRSALELQFIEYCENSQSVKKWAAEPFYIPYYSRIKHKDQKYYPDYIIESKNGDKIIVEIKPFEQTVKPKENDSAWLKEAWIVNTDKWAAAKKFADDNSMKFVIITEKFFSF